MAGLDRAPSLALRPLQRSGVQVFAWGRADMGQLGVVLVGAPKGDQDDGMAVDELECALLPVPVVSLGTADVIHIAAGPFNTAFQTADGEVYTCGANDSGELGRRTSIPSCNTATRLEALDVHKVTHMAYGQSHALAVTDKGSCLSWGAGEWGQLGLGAEALMQSYPRLVKGVKTLRLARVAAGACHSLALSSSGHVWSFGQGTFGQLGHGNDDNCPSPKLIHRLWHVGVVQVSCGENHSAALAADGRLYTWGRGKYGALGCGDFKSQSLPQVVRALQGIPLTQVVCGGDHTLVLSTTGVVYSWGRNSWGQLGLGSVDNTCSPNVVQGALEGQRVVQIAAGLRHSTALTSANEVLVWGCGEQGQLGGGKRIVAQPSPIPLPPLALPPMPVMFLAAGGDHTLAVIKDLAPGEKVVVGPVPPVLLPHGAHHAAHGAGMLPLPLPQLLQMTQAAAVELGVLVEEGGEGTRKAIGPGGEMSPGSQGGVFGPALTALINAIEDVFMSTGFLAAGFGLPPLPPHGSQGSLLPAPPSLPPPETAATIPTKLLVPAGLNLGGGNSSNGSGSPEQKQMIEDAMQRKAVTPHNIDIEAVNAVYQSLLRLYSQEVVAALSSACASLLDTLDYLMQPLNLEAASPLSPGRSSGAVCRLEHLLPCTAVLPALLVLLINPLNSHALVLPSLPLTAIAAGKTAALMGGSLWSRLAHVWVQLPKEQQRMLAFWAAGLPPDVFGGRVLRPLQQHISRSVERGGQRGRSDVLNAAQGCTALLGTSPAAPVLQPMPLSEWNNKTLSESWNLREEYMIFVQLESIKVDNPHQLVSICQAPILLTPEAKSRILQGEAALQKQAHVQNSAISAYLQGINPGAVVYLDVHVRRDHVMQDALTQILHRPEDLKKPLRVTFIGPGGVPEEGLDEGGVSREFFQLLVHEIFRAEYGMFVWNDETRTFWFNPCSFETELEFRLVGAVFGLAIYNNIILDVHLPMVTYKKLLGQTPGWRDLCEAQPSLARGLAALLNFDGDVETTFCRNFEVEYEYFGSTRRQELLPNGANIPVTEKNRQQYVELYTKWILEGSIASQFKAFSQGFHQVCGGPALSLLNSQELELLVAGLPHLDFNALEAGSRYEGGYDKDTPVVRWFWQELHAMNMEQKRRFLSFTTGCDRAPVGGLGKLTLTIQGKLRERLMTAMDNAQGFGLQ